MTTADAQSLTLPDLKVRLNIKTPGNDGELQDLLDGAVAEYVQWVGPLADPVPANVRELILADVAGLYSATQRGVRARPDLSGVRSEEAGAYQPMLLYPRIRAYAKSARGPAFSFPAPAPWPA